MTSLSLTDQLSAARQILSRVGQDHVLTFFDDLPNDQKNQLLAQIQEIDWTEVARLIQTHVKNRPSVRLPEQLGPVPYYPSVPRTDLVDKYKRARALGEDLIRHGKAAAFTVAGGQGTRLGWSGPKGTYPATPIRKLPLFGCFAEYLRKIQKKFGTACRWYIMTSPANDAPTRAYFQEHGYFGLEPDHVLFFVQAMMPAIAIDTGKVLMESKASLALSPNGHGGALKALYTSGALDDMKRHGIEQISYTQIDNPLVKVIDPLFLGLHVQDQCEMSSKMVVKAYPEERLGVFCLVDGRVTVVEYSDLPNRLAQQRQPDGQLQLSAGSIAIHAISVNFVESLNRTQDGFGLPYHRADKKVRCMDFETAATINPDSSNAVKLETFVFDALPMCEHSIVFETPRVEEFAPIKNAEGQDSPLTSRQLQTERAARWLESKGVRVPRNSDGQVDAVIEISQLTAIESADLERIKLPESIETGTEVLL